MHRECRRGRECRRAVYYRSAWKCRHEACVGSSFLSKCPHDVCRTYIETPKPVARNMTTSDNLGTTSDKFVATRFNPFQSASEAGHEPSFSVTERHFTFSYNAPHRVSGMT